MVGRLGERNVERDRPKTQAEARKERFASDAQRARTLGDYALRQVDACLAGQDELLAALRGSDLPDEEIGVRLQAYRDGYLRNTEPES